VRGFQLPLLGSNQDSPDPESAPADLITGQPARFPALSEHRRPELPSRSSGKIRRNDDETMMALLS
jgi:hypothetical protein